MTLHAPRRFAAALLALSAWATDAAASGFASARFGGETGHPTTTNPTALYFNPAGIALARGTHLYLDGTLALRNVTWTHETAANDPPAPDGANDGTAKLFNVFGAPMLGATFGFGDLALGAALFVPFGGRSHWSKNEDYVDSDAYPLVADGVQRWHSIQGAITHAYGAAGAAYRLGPLSLGATVNAIRSQLKSERAKNFTGQALPDVDSEGRAIIDVSSWHASFGVGAILTALPDRLWLGVSYQAQPGLGTLAHDGTLTIEDRGVSGDLGVTLHEALPDITRAGLRFRPVPTWELRAFGDYTRWSAAQTTCVALRHEPCVVTSTGSDANAGVITLNLLRAWKNTLGVRAGVSHWPTPALELLAGAGYETAATPDKTLDPELPDANNLAGALGARWQLSDGLFIGATYTHLYYLARDNRGQSILSRSDIPTRRPDGGGRYEQWIGVFNANVELAF